MTFGPLIGGLILFLDYLKGTLTVALIDHLFSLDYFVAPNGTNIWYALSIILGPFCCILGHNYSVWLKFDGGQGLGVYMGTVFYLNPLVILFHNVFIITVMLSGRVNVRAGTFIGILIEMIMIMFIPIFPPWTNIANNSFPWAPSFLHLKAMLVLFAMAIALLIKVVQSIRSKHKSASWTVGKNGEQQFSQN
jgi:glycerol-3-phosphate acyltransferase PlsY